MLNNAVADDYVLATGITTSVEILFLLRLES